MKKVKRIELISGVHVLDSIEQKRLRGTGDIPTNRCRLITTKEQCYGSCINHQGIPGFCSYIYPQTSVICECAVIYVG